MEGKARPVVGGFPSLFAADGELGGAEGGGGGHVVLEEVAVEGGHEHGGGAVVDAPVADHDAADSGAEEGLGEAYHAFPSHLPSQSGLAGAEDCQLGGEVQAGHVGGGEEAFAAFSVIVDQGEDDSGSFREDRVQEPVGGEVQDAVAAQGTAQDQVAVGRGPQGQEPWCRQPALNNPVEWVSGRQGASLARKPSR